MRLDRIVQKYKTMNKKHRVLLAGSFSTIWNALIGIGKMLLGFLFFSPWYVINGIYYLILGIARGSTIHTYIRIYAQADIQKSFEDECLMYRKSGLFVGLLGFSYLLVSLRMYYRADVTHFPDYVVFGVVIVSLSKLFSSLYRLFWDRHSKDLVVRVLRVFSFADAGVSLVMTRCALLLIVRAPEAVANSALFGMIISVSLLLVGLFMWRRTF